MFTCLFKIETGNAQKPSYMTTEAQILITMGKKGLRIRFGGLEINNFLAFKCCITLKEKCDFKLLTIGFE